MQIQGLQLGIIAQDMDKKISSATDVRVSKMGNAPGRENSIPGHLSRQ